jgi:hypothetical protein
MATVVEDTLTNLEQIPELTQEGWKYLVSNQQDESMETSGRKPSTTVPIFGDENTFWKVNFQRFFAHLRDQELIQAFTNRIDQVKINTVLFLLYFVFYFRMLVKLFEQFFV